MAATTSSETSRIRMSTMGTSAISTISRRFQPRSTFSTIPVENDVSGHIDGLAMTGTLRGASSSSGAR
jgi:hypothetical protein